MDKQTKVSVYTMDAKEYLKLKGLKNPPIDSGISGGGDANPIRPSDVMIDFAKQYSRHKLIVLIEENANLEAQNKELREALGMYDHWPITDVLLKLVEATEYLLDVKNYDRHGWEEVSHCTKVGREMVLKIQQALKEDKKDG